MEEENLVSQKGVRIVKFEQVDSFPWIIVAAYLHFPMTVSPVDRHDLPITISQITFGAPFHITNRNRP